MTTPIAWWMVIIILAGIISLCGCGANDTEKKLSNQEQLENSELVETNIRDTYYKLRMETAKLDVDAITKYLLGESGQYINQAIEVESVYPNETCFELSVNGERHTWTYNTAYNNYFFLYNEDESFAGIPESDKALNIANEIAELVDSEFSENVEINTFEQDGGETMFTYVQQYKGVDILGNSHVRASSADESIDGIWMDVEVDANGVKLVGINNMSHVTEEIDTYSKDDLLDIASAASAGEAYARKMILFNEENQDLEINGGAKEISVIYIPMKEENEVFWVPGYKVICEFDMDGKNYRSQLILDAFNGYVYDWSGL